MKKLTVLLCALLLILSVTSAAHAEEIYTEGTLYYTIGNETVTIVGCFGRKTEVTVPASIAGYPVNTIASGAFMTNNYLELLKLPDTITVIEKDAVKEGVRVIYNANTNHPQDEVPDIITGREPILVPADQGETQRAKSEDKKANPSESQTTGSDDRQSSAENGSGGDRIMEADVDLTDEEASEKTSDSSTSVSAQEASSSADTTGDLSPSAAISEGSTNDSAAATSHEVGSGNNVWLIISISAAVVAVVAFVIYMIRKKKKSGKK